MKTRRLKILVGAVVLGVLVSLATGIIENPPEAGIIGARYYGYPLAWRFNLVNSTEFRFTNLAVDVSFWFAISLIALIIIEKALIPKFGSPSVSSIGLSLSLFVPLGLAMDFLHESGHAAWGIAFGGRLTYMKIAYFEIYPKLALTPEFILGLVRIEGLATGFANGFFLLGGSMTTNTVSWLLALILLRVGLGSKTQVALKVLGLFGILDLPFYVILPQIGLRHCFFLGGETPEPLIGARRIGIPDPTFYIVVAFTTLGLLLLYFKFFWERCWERTRCSEV